MHDLDKQKMDGQRMMETDIGRCGKLCEMEIDNLWVTIIWYKWHQTFFRLSPTGINHHTFTTLISTFYRLSCMCSVNQWKRSILLNRPIRGLSLCLLETSGTEITFYNLIYSLVNICVNAIGNYLNCCITKLPLIKMLVCSVLFSVMSHSVSDQLIWNDFKF